MKNLWPELKKIARQTDGSENIFGYKSTVANQLYLLYCFSGKIYFTGKIHRHVKCLWYGVVLCQILLLFLIGWTYLWYEAANNDLTVMLNVANGVAGLLTGVFAIPLISFLYSNSIETMIERVDNILTTDGISDLNQKKILADAKKNFLAFFGLFFLLITINFSICFFDVALLFEESKVKNYLYYAFPVFLAQKYASIESFFIVNGISTMIFAVMVSEAWTVLGVISYWSTVWYNELIYLCEGLNTGMHRLDVAFGERGSGSDDWNEAFECILKRFMSKFKTITLLIDDLRGCVEVYGTVFVYALYFFSLFFLYNTFSRDISLVLFVKSITGCLSCIVMVFFFYWIGQNLENSVFEISMALYSTPWYRSVKVRKNVYILLCETKSVKIFTIFKVYRLLMNNFSRYVQALMSYTNILIKLTKK